MQTYATQPKPNTCSLYIAVYEAAEEEEEAEEAEAAEEEAEEEAAAEDSAGASPGRMMTCICITGTCHCSQPGCEKRVFGCYPSLHMTLSLYIKCHMNGHA